MAAWVQAEWGPSGMCQNALALAPWVSTYMEVSGWPFQRVDETGRDIRVAVPKGEFL